MYTKSSLVLLLLLGCSLQRVYLQSTEPTTEASSSSEVTAIDNTGSTGSTEIDVTPTDPAPFSCSAFGGTPVDLEAISGDWYEVARAPNVDATQCLKYALPASPNADNKLDVQLEYVNTADNKWEHAQESGRLPWDDNAKNGIFNLIISETPKLTVTFKLVDTDPKSHALVCGYMSLTPQPLFKVLTRKRELNEEEKNLVQEKFNAIVQGQELVWVEQSEQKCNSAMRSAGGVLVALALALLIFQRNH